jgi:hypothetical protein
MDEEKNRKMDEPPEFARQKALEAYQKIVEVEQDPNYVEPVLEELQGPTREKWDCESIVSTYSNTGIIRVIILFFFSCKHLVSIALEILNEFFFS